MDNEKDRFTVFCWNVFESKGDTDYRKAAMMNELSRPRDLVFLQEMNFQPDGRSQGDYIPPARLYGVHYTKETGGNIHNGILYNRERFADSEEPDFKTVLLKSFYSLQWQVDCFKTWQEMVPKLKSKKLELEKEKQALDTKYSVSEEEELEVELEVEARIKELLSMSTHKDCPQEKSKEELVVTHKELEKMRNKLEGDLKKLDQRKQTLEKTIADTRKNTKLVLKLKQIKEKMKDKQRKWSEIMSELDNVVEKLKQLDDIIEELHWKLEEINNEQEVIEFDQEDIGEDLQIIERKLSHDQTWEELEKDVTVADKHRDAKRRSIGLEWIADRLKIPKYKYQHLDIPKTVDHIRKSTLSCLKRKSEVLVNCLQRESKRPRKNAKQKEKSPGCDFWTSLLRDVTYRFALTCLTYRKDDKNVIIAVSFHNRKNQPKEMLHVLLYLLREFRKLMKARYSGKRFHIVLAGDFNTDLFFFQP
jgi:myosin heavy subunit